MFIKGRRMFSSPCPGIDPSHASIVLIVSTRAVKPRLLTAFSASRA